MHHKLLLSFVLHGERQCTINNLLLVLSFVLYGERQCIINNNYHLCDMGRGSAQ